MRDKATLYKIKNEILKDDYKAYVSEGRHYDLSNRLNDTLVTIDQPVSVSDLNSFADTYGLLIVLEDVVDKKEGAVEVIKAARQILRVFTAKYPTVDLTLDTVKAVFQVLVDANIFTQEIVDAIFALGKTKVSLSIYKFGSLTSSGDIADALNLP